MYKLPSLFFTAITTLKRILCIKWHAKVCANVKRLYIKFDLDIQVYRAVLHASLLITETAKNCTCVFIYQPFNE